jgi:hypothetical protein
MLDKGSCLCALGVGVGAVGASGNGLSCLVLSFPKVKDVPAAPAAKLNGTKGGRSESQPMEKTGYGVKAKPKTGVRTGAGPFSFSVVKEDGGTGTGRGWSADCTPVRVVWQSNHRRLRSAVVGLLIRHHTYRSSYSRTVAPHSLS